MHNLNGKDQTNDSYEELSHKAHDGFVVRRVYANQIPDHWDMIAPIIEHTLPEWAKGDIPTMTNVLKSLMSNQSMLTLFDKGGELAGCFITSAQKDPVLGVRILHISAMYTFKALKRSDIETLFAWLKEHARMEGCKMIYAFTDNKGMVSYIKRKGGDVEKTVLGIEV